MLLIFVHLETSFFGSMNIKQEKVKEGKNATFPVSSSQRTMAKLNTSAL